MKVPRIARESRPDHIRPCTMTDTARASSSIGRIATTEEQRNAVQRIAIDTFTEMVNMGQSFQSALAAVYMSGVVHALEMTK